MTPRAVVPAIPVTWVVSTRRDFAAVHATGTAAASTAHDFTVKARQQRGEG